MNGNGINRVEELFVAPEKLLKARKEAALMTPIELSTLDLQWVQVLSEGWASPLKGFMNEEQYLQSLHFKCLMSAGSTNQSIPIVLAISDSDKSATEGKLQFKPSIYSS